MALDPGLLEKFERDWNDALANYEARATVSRLSDVSVAPWARTQIDPQTSAALQSELFAPLQAKWGLLTERARRASTAPTSTRPMTFNTRAGVFERDPFTGEYRKVVDVPPSTRAPGKPRQFSAVVGEDMLGKPTRLGMSGEEFENWMKNASPELRTNLVNEAISQMLGKEEAMALPATNAPAITPPPQASGFMGTPGGENLFAAPLQAAPPPPATSLKRFKWVQGQLQPQ